MIKPVNNQCLIEVIDEYAGLSHSGGQEQRGIVRDVNFTPIHLTASTGLLLPEKLRDDIKLDLLVGQTVRYALYADADSLKFAEDDKEYVLIPWYRILGIEVTK